MSKSNYTYVISYSDQAPAEQNADPVSLTVQEVNGTYELSFHGHNLSSIMEQAAKNRAAYAEKKEKEQKRKKSKWPKVNRTLTDEQRLTEATWIVDSMYGFIQSMFSRVVYGGWLIIDRDTAPKQIWAKGCAPLMESEQFQELKANAMGVLWRRLLRTVHSLPQPIDPATVPDIVPEPIKLPRKGKKLLPKKQWARHTRFEVETAQSSRVEKKRVEQCPHIRSAIASLARSCIKDSIRSIVTYGHEYGYESEEAANKAARDDFTRRNKRVKLDKTHATNQERQQLDPEDIRVLEPNDSYIVLMDGEIEAAAKQLIPDRYRQTALSLVFNTQRKTAEHLGMDIKTVESHVRKIKQSLGFIATRRDFYDWLGGVLVEARSDKYCSKLPHHDAYWVHGLDGENRLHLVFHEEDQPKTVRTVVTNHRRVAGTFDEVPNRHYWTKWTWNDYRPLGISCRQRSDWADAITARRWRAEFDSLQQSWDARQSNPYWWICTALSSLLQQKPKRMYFGSYTDQCPDPYHRTRIIGQGRYDTDYVEQYPVHAAQRTQLSSDQYFTAPTDSKQLSKLMRVRCDRSGDMQLTTAQPDLILTYSKRQDGRFARKRSKMGRYRRVVLSSNQHRGGKYDASKTAPLTGLVKHTPHIASVGVMLFTQSISIY